MKTDPKLDLSLEQMQVWHSRIKRAYRARKPFYENWLKMDDYYEGRYFTDYSEVDRVSGNWHMVATHQMVAQVYTYDPAMNFAPKTVEGQFLASVNEQLTSYERDLIHIDEQERRALFHALKYGKGIIKYAWNWQYGMEPPIAAKVPKDQMQSAVRGATPDTGADDDMILKQGLLTEYNANTTQGHCWAMAVHPCDFLIDPEAKTLEEARWMVHRFSRPWIDMVRDPRYDDEARKMLQPTGPSDFFVYGDDATMPPEKYDLDPAVRDASMVTAYEIFNKCDQTIIVVAEGCEKALMVRPYPFAGKAFRKGPFEDITPIPSEDSYWGLPWADTFTPQVLAINKLRTQMMDHLQRLGIPKGVVSRGRIRPDDLQRFMEATTATLVEMDVADDINNHIKFMEYVPIAADAWRLADTFKGDFQEISGISEMSLGGGGGVQTATEANYIQQQSGLRVSDIRNTLDRFLRNSTRKIVALMQQFFDNETVMRVVGPDGLTMNWPINRAVINAEYTVDIEPGSTERVDRNAKMRQTIELMQQLLAWQPYMIQQGMAFNLPELAKTLLRRVDVVKDPNRIMYQIPQQPQPVQPQQQQPGAPNTQAPQPAAVNGFDNVINASEQFQRGRQASEAFS